MGESTLVRVIFWATVVAYAAVWVVLAFALPDRVPLHFDGDGDPDRWGTRTSALVTLGLIGVGLVAVFVGAVWLVDRLRLTSPMVNLPHKQWWTATPERTSRARTMLRSDLHAIGAMTLVLIAIIELLVLRAAQEAEPRLGASAWVAVGAYLAAVVGWSVWMTRGRYRPEEER